MSVTCARALAIMVMTTVAIGTATFDAVYASEPISKGGAQAVQPTIQPTIQPNTEAQITSLQSTTQALEKRVAALEAALKSMQTSMTTTQTSVATLSRILQPLAQFSSCQLGTTTLGILQLQGNQNQPIVSAPGCLPQ
jgi:TolA-binding protein